MKEANGSLRTKEEPDEHALGGSIPVGKLRNTSEQAGQLQTLKVSGKPRFPPRSDSAESIDPQPRIILKERHL
jgi:hypothetical protein